MLRLLRLRAKNEALSPLTNTVPERLAWSPVRGSTLMTSAPMSASICVQNGPKIRRDRSNTHMPSRGLGCCPRCARRCVLRRCNSVSREVIRASSSCRSPASIPVYPFLADPHPYPLPEGEGVRRPPRQTGYCVPQLAPPVWRGDCLPPPAPPLWRGTKTRRPPPNPPSSSPT